ncbi:MAG: ketopantoate reductase, partial [Myxococcota bacterium]
MRVLLVGAGAVGQVYGRHLELGGAEVSVYVKEKYAEDCRSGLTLYPLKKRGVYEPVRWKGFGVLTSPAEVATQSFDQVWLCMSATALQGDWFEAFVASIGQATLVTLQPGIEQRQWLAARYPPERTIFGGITFISYQAPLTGETVAEPGVAYWFPPLTKSPFSGEAALLSPLLACLKAGGCPAAKHSDTARALAAPTAVMMPHLAALELAGWSFSALGADARLAVAGEASREAMVISARHYGRGAPFLRHFIRPWAIRVVMWLAPRIIPFDIETYLEYHFTKVGDQTRYLLKDLIGRGETASLAVDAS